MEKSNISESKIARRTPIIKYSRMLVPRSRTPWKMILSELLRDTQKDFSRSGLLFALSLLKYLGISTLKISRFREKALQRSCYHVLKAASLGTIAMDVMSKKYVGIMCDGTSILP